MKKASRQEFKPHEIKAHKKQVARLLTVKREREIEQGVSKRESRRNEKNAALAKYKQQLKDSNIVIQRPKSQKLRWKKREAARGTRRGGSAGWGATTRGAVVSHGGREGGGASSASTLVRVAIKSYHENAFSLGLPSLLSLCLPPSQPVRPQRR